MTTYKIDMRDNSFNLTLLSKYRQHIFALAIIMIVFHHLTFKMLGNTVMAKAYMFLRVTGATGVDIFLFLAGFGCWYSFSKDENEGAFYKRRLLRILPAYLAVAIPAYFITDILLKSTGFFRFFADVSLISFWIDGGSDWYIAASLFLYLLFPVIYRITKGFKPIKAIICLLFIWLIVVIVIFLLNASYFDATNRLWARIPVFLFGTLIAPYIKTGYVVSNWNKKLILLFMIVFISLSVEALLALKGSAYAYSFSARLMYCPLSISLVFIAVFLIEKLNNHFLNYVLTFIGEITLEIYMLNQRLIDLSCFVLTRYCNFSTNSLTGNIVGIFLTIIISWKLHNFIEGKQHKLNKHNGVS